jgi:hypothetical protein
LTRFLGDDSQVYLRKANESIEVYESEISSNEHEAFYAFTPLRELNQGRIYLICAMTFRLETLGIAILGITITNMAPSKTSFRVLIY